jgi:23S rRNA pseudouridine2605 synthase
VSPFCVVRENNLAEHQKPRSTGLARALSKLGYCSRSQGFALVRSGRVTVNGRVHRDPEYPVRTNDRVAVDSRSIAAAEKLYLMMNKPRGLVTTAADEKGRATVYSLLDPALGWLAPVGRLDQASEGLLLLTNDSGWAASIASPDSHVTKMYRVQIASVADEVLQSQLVGGVKDGSEVLSAVRASILRAGKRNSWVELVLTEGRNRQIRRMFAGLDIEVLRLLRVAIGPLVLGDLAKGQVRPLTQEEKAALDHRMPGTLHPAVKKPSSRRA